MLKPNNEVPWGNHIAFIPVRVPITEKIENRLELVSTAKSIMDRYKMSLGVFINDRIMTGSKVKRTAGMFKLLSFIKRQS